ncbi:MAG TPA: hypothetical protein VKU87_08440 [Thermomicrobiaceae bacterium]|nr:hypothetical protein [Thermomicrobiaceae bacterium]
MPLDELHLLDHSIELARQGRFQSSGTVLRPVGCDRSLDDHCLWHALTVRIVREPCGEIGRQFKDLR